MKTFMLILTLWNGNSTPPDVYVMDYNLSGEDCIATLIHYEESHPDSLSIASCEAE